MERMCKLLLSLSHCIIQFSSTCMQCFFPSSGIWHVHAFGKRGRKGFGDQFSSRAKILYRSDIVYFVSTSSSRLRFWWLVFNLFHQSLVCSKLTAMTNTSTTQQQQSSSSYHFITPNSPPTPANITDEQPSSPPSSPSTPSSVSSSSSSSNSHWTCPDKPTWTFDLTNLGSLIPDGGGQPMDSIAAAVREISQLALAAGSWDLPLRDGAWESRTERPIQFGIQSQSQAQTQSQSQRNNATTTAASSNASPFDYQDAWWAMACLKSYWFGRRGGVPHAIQQGGIRILLQQQQNGADEQGDDGQGGDKQEQGREQALLDIWFGQAGTAGGEGVVSANATEIETS